MKISDDEIFMLSDGLLSLISNCSEAIKLVKDKKVQKAIQNTIRKYQALNEKLMEEIDGRLGVNYQINKEEK